METYRQKSHAINYLETPNFRIRIPASPPTSHSLVGASARLPAGRDSRRGCAESLKHRQFRSARWRLGWSSCRPRLKSLLRRIPEAPPVHSAQPAIRHVFLLVATLVAAAPNPSSLTANFAFARWHLRATTPVSPSSRHRRAKFVRRRQLSSITEPRATRSTAAQDRSHADTW